MGCLCPDNTFGFSSTNKVGSQVTQVLVTGQQPNIFTLFKANWIISRQIKKLCLFDSIGKFRDNNRAEWKQILYYPPLLHLL